MLPLVQTHTSNNMEPQSNPSVFFGYTPRSNSYKTYNPATKNVFISCHASFQENHFPFNHLTSTPHTPPNCQHQTSASHLLVHASTKLSSKLPITLSSITTSDTPSDRVGPLTPAMELESSPQPPLKTYVRRTNHHMQESHREEPTGPGGAGPCQTGP